VSPAKTIHSLPGLFLGAVLLAGCRSPAPAAKPPKPAVAQDALRGEVLRVNTRERYAVVRCTVLPTSGKEVTVFRRDQPVGKLRITDPRSPPYATADIVEGRPMRGDRIRE
jgi:hypothetical protein